METFVTAPHAVRLREFVTRMELALGAVASADTPEDRHVAREAYARVLDAWAASTRAPRRPY